MESPRRWTTFAFIIYLSFQDTHVFSQNVASSGGPANVMTRDNRDCSRPSGNSMSTELLNTILNTAAANGVLPDLLPMLQGQPIPDNLQRFSFPQEALTKPLSVVSMSPSGCVNSQDPTLRSGQQIRTTNQHVLHAIPVSCGSGCPNTMSAIPQSISPPPPNCLPQISQAVPLENYPICAQNVGVVQSTPLTLQPQCQYNEVNPYNVYNQIAETLSLPELNIPAALSLPICPPPQVLPDINAYSGTLEINPTLGLPCLSQPTAFTSDGQQLPLSLQINVPQPSAPAARITVVSASPPNTPVAPPAPYYPDYPSNSPPFQYPPLPPIVLEGCSKSSLRDLLPIMLLALFSDRGCNNFGGGCCCCCSSNSGSSGNIIPIPIPIPIPINNLMVNTCSSPFSSRNREYRDDRDDDEEKKRK